MQSGVQATRKEHLKTIIEAQKVEGFWVEDVLSFATKGANPSFFDNLLRLVYERTQNDEEYVFWTLTNLWVLETYFSDKEGEWQMIAEKAKRYLKAHNVTDITKIFKDCA